MRHSLNTVYDWTCEVIGRVCFVFCASAVVGGVIKSSGRETEKNNWTNYFRKEEQFLRRWQENLTGEE